MPESKDNFDHSEYQTALQQIVDSELKNSNFDLTNSTKFDITESTKTTVLDSRKIIANTLINIGSKIRKVTTQAFSPEEQKKIIFSRFVKKHTRDLDNEAERNSVILALTQSEDGRSVSTPLAKSIQLFAMYNSIGLGIKITELGTYFNLGIIDANKLVTPNYYTNLEFINDLITAGSLTLYFRAGGCILRPPATFLLSKKINVDYGLTPTLISAIPLFGDYFAILAQLKPALKNGLLKTAPKTDSEPSQTPQISI